MAVKFDMSKTYDRIEWPYLEVVLTSFGFSERWIHLTMSCVLSIQYSVIIDGSLGEVFSPMRRLRKGEPLSPYLLLLCTEGFNSLMDKTKKRGVLRGLGVSNGGTRINHLLFVDDYVLFGKANRKEWHKM